MENIKYGKRAALKEYLLSNEPISRLEAILMFGTQNLPVEMTHIRNEGYIVHSQKTPMIKILRRLQKYCICKTPSNLPVKEILITEYWVSK